MGKGRAPCCDKNQVKRGPWSTSEDLRLITFIQKHGHDNWRALPKQAGLLRCGKSCRLRWINYLRPDLKRGNFTKQEEDTIIKLHQAWGNKWSKIASQLPGRTDNEIKNVWNTHLKKRLACKGANSHGDEISSITSSSSSSSSTFTSCGKQNMEVETERESDKGSTGKNPRGLTHLEKVQDSEKVEDPFHSAKDPREQTSSSVSSYDSNASNSSPVDVSRPEEQMFSLLHYGGPYDVTNMLQEVNRPHVMDDALEVPLEADADFWNMLDSLDSVLPNTIQPDQADACQSPNSGEGNGKEVENDKWLRYLESELGLDAVGEENKEMSAKEADVPLAPESFQRQIVSMPEPSPDVSCLPMWPSWSQTSAI